MCLTAVLTPPIPLWLFLLLLILGIFAAVELQRYWKISSDLRRQNNALEVQRNDAETREEMLEASLKTLEAINRDLQADNEDIHAEKYHLEQQIAELTSNGPRLHGVWNNSESFWLMCRKGTEPVMQIGGQIHLSSSNTNEVLHLLAAYIEGQRLDLLMPVSVRPDVIEEEQVVLYMSPPLESDVTRPFTATITLEDHQNRLHMLPRHTFRPTEQTPPWVYNQPT